MWPTTILPLPLTTNGGAPGPTQTGIFPGCEEWYIVKANDTCTSITKQYSISQAQFYAWNLAIGGIIYNLARKEPKETRLIYDILIQRIALTSKLMMPIV